MRTCVATDPVQTPCTAQAPLQCQAQNTAHITELSQPLFPLFQLPRTRTPSCPAPHSRTAGRGCRCAPQMCRQRCTAGCRRPRRARDQPRSAGSAAGACAPHSRRRHCPPAAHGPCLAKAMCADELRRLRNRCRWRCRTTLLRRAVLTAGLPAEEVGKGWMPFRPTLWSRDATCNLAALVW